MNKPQRAVIHLEAPECKCQAQNSSVAFWAEKCSFIPLRGCLNQGTKSLSASSSSLVCCRVLCRVPQTLWFYCLLEVVEDTEMDKINRGKGILVPQVRDSSCK